MDSRAPLLVLCFTISLVMACGSSEDPPLSFYPGTLHLEEDAGATGRFYVALDNPGRRAAPARVETSAPWIVATPPSLTLDAEGRQTLEVFVTCPLQTGSFREELVVIRDAQDDTPERVDARLPLSIYCHPSPAFGAAAATVTVQGLPPNVPADLRLAGPADTEITFQDAQTFENLPPGRYFLTAAPLTFQGYELVAEPEVIPLTLYDGDHLHHEVTYGLVDTRRTQVEIIPEGLPDGLHAQIRITTVDETFEASLPAAFELSPGPIELAFPMVLDPDDEPGSGYRTLSAPRSLFLLPGDHLPLSPLYRHATRRVPEEPLPISASSPKLLDP